MCDDVDNRGDVSVGLDSLLEVYGEDMIHEGLNEGPELVSAGLLSDHTQRYLMGNPAVKLRYVSDTFSKEMKVSLQYWQKKGAFACSCGVSSLGRGTAHTGITGVRIAKRGGRHPVNEEI